MGWNLVIKGVGENVLQKLDIDDTTKEYFIAEVRQNITANTGNFTKTYGSSSGGPTIAPFYANYPQIDSLAFTQQIASGSNSYASPLFTIEMKSNNQSTDYYMQGCYENYGGGTYGASVMLTEIPTLYRHQQLVGETLSNSNRILGYIYTIIDDKNVVGVAYLGRLTSTLVDVKISYVILENYCERYHYNMPETAYISDNYGYPSEAGGYTGGTFDDSSDVISLPTMPTIGVTSAGFVNVYNPSIGDLQNFGSELFPDLTFTPSSPVSGSLSVSDAIEAMANALVDLGNQIPNIVNMYINSNLIQYVIDCHILPVAPTQGASEQIKVGFRQFSITSPKVTSDYVDFDCGTLSIGEYYANFIDYAPYTHAKLFLPFVGFVDLAPEFWQSGTVQIIYRFNIIDGSFMAFVLSTSSKSKLTNSVIMQFGGNACVHIPITGLNYSSMVSGVVSGASAVISQASGGSIPASAVAGIKESITQASAVMQNKPPLQQSNGYNSTTSFLSVRKPYLLIERSVSNFSVNYPEEKGIPSNITADFNVLSGYTQATNIHLDGITGATEEELNELSRLLGEGVIL